MRLSRLSPAEVAATQAQPRQKFIDQARTIPYNQLIKNPDAYVGTKVKYYGEILQIKKEGTGFHAPVRDAPRL